MFQSEAHFKMFELVAQQILTSISWPAEGPKSLDDMSHKGTFISENQYKLQKYIKKCFAVSVLLYYQL